MFYLNIYNYIIRKELVPRWRRPLAKAATSLWHLREKKTRLLMRVNLYIKKEFL